MRRLIPLAIASVLFLACQDHVGLPDRLGPGETSLALVDADNHGSNEHARWLEPIVKTAQVENFGTFDPTVESAQLHVACVGCVGDWKDPENAIDRYRVSDGSLMIQDDHYHAQVELGHLSISDGTDQTLYVLVATVRPFGEESDPIVVAYADFRVLSNGRAKSSLREDEIGLVGSKLPAMIRLDVGVLADAASDALEDESYELPAGPLADAVASYDDGEFSATVVKPGVKTEATFEEGGLVTGAFLFEGDEVLDPIVLFIGIPRNEEGEDICGEAFSFEKSGCKRALAVPLVGGEDAPSDITSGFVFEKPVQFCIATDIAESDERPWELIKIDDHGSGPVFTVLPQLGVDACDLVDDPEHPPVLSLRTEPVDWLRHHVGQRVLDFLVTPLYADHPPSRMGSTLQDLSDLTAALLPDLTVLIACPVDASGGGDEIDRGFYIGSYPGSGLTGVKLYLNSDPDVNETVEFMLTARSEDYGGQVLGRSTASANLMGTSNQNAEILFTFGSVAVTPGTTVTFALERTSDPVDGRIFYNVGGFPLNDPEAEGCEVTQTEGNVPLPGSPLNQFRRAGIAIQVFGDPEPEG